MGSLRLPAVQRGPQIFTQYVQLATKVSFVQKPGALHFRVDYLPHLNPELLTVKILKANIKCMCVPFYEHCMFLFSNSSCLIYFWGYRTVFVVDY